MHTQNDDTMIIDDLQLPLSLQETLRSGGWMMPGEGFNGRWRDASKISLFREIFVHEKSPLPELFNFEEMKNVNEMWSKPDIAKFYLGSASEIYPPGDIDPSMAIIIGGTEPDSPIALDYRVSQPRLIYFCGIGGKSLWVEALESVDLFIDKFDLA